MTLYRDQPPQMGGELFLTDAGMETDIIFNYGIDIREFAAHTLLPDQSGREALETYYNGFLALADELGVGFILDAPIWKAHRHWADDLCETPQQLQSSNEAAIEFIARLREQAPNRKPIVLNAQIGPRGDAYAPEDLIQAHAAREYFREQIGWLAQTEVDMVTAMTFTQASEAQGFVEAAKEFRLPSVVSFTVETDGKLPSGQTLEDAIKEIDANTSKGPSYYMINCAHPDHFAAEVERGDWRRRIQGIRANASRKSHAELDGTTELDAGDTKELAADYVELKKKMPWLNVFGACCGADLRHVSAIARELSDEHVGSAAD